VSFNFDLSCCEEIIKHDDVVSNWLLDAFGAVLHSEE